MSGTNAAGIGKTKQEAIDDLEWRVSVQDVFDARQVCVVKRDREYVATYRLERKDYERP